MNHLQSFQHHCQIYYQKSLSISNHLKDANGKGNYNDCSFEESKVVLDLFEHHIRYSPQPPSSSVLLSNAKQEHIEITIEQKDMLLSAKVKKYSDVLKKCGLFIEYNDDPSKIKYLPQHVLGEYTRIKDKERRNAHVTKMKERNKIFFCYLQENIQNERLKSLSKIIIDQYDVTTQNYLAYARSRIRDFVKKYQKNIGSHSLLAGMKNVIEKQIEMEDQICLWKFSSTVITESSLFLHMNGENGNSSYMKDCINVLTSFLVYCGEERDVETSAKNDGSDESLVLFHIHPFISNAFLRHILCDIPSSLDSRPTGTFGCFDHNNEEASQILVRSNCVGQLDESYLMKFVLWSKSFCEIM